MAPSNKKLGKAPLAEVVFELRWDIGVRPGATFMPTDPGFPVLQRNFEPWSSKAGMPEVELIAKEDHVVLPHSVAARFRPAKGQLFPIWQIGPGLYASNDSSNYEWSSFKKQSMKGLEGVLRTYPEISSLPFKPISLELRYWDLFDGDVLGQKDLISFINDSFDMNVSIPKFCQDQSLFGVVSAGTLRFSFPVKGQKDTVFTLELTSGRRQGTPLVRMESKVITRPTNLSGARRTLAPKIAAWLDRAHQITSPFFRSVIKPSLMEKFK